ncbi:hypothetical protein [Pannonibacter phragmitetus]|uniref:hypothetical protein n=1 Tax=Pannonibacter phragmitetus TaxID=121719 RepID=UPI003D2EB292
MKCRRCDGNSVGNAGFMIKQPRRPIMTSEHFWNEWHLAQLQETQRKHHAIDCCEKKKLGQGLAQSEPERSSGGKLGITAPIQPMVNIPKQTESTSAPAARCWPKAETGMPVAAARMQKAPASRRDTLLGIFMVNRSDEAAKAAKTGKTTRRAASIILFHRV